MFSKPHIPPPPWKDGYHHLLQACMVILGLYLSLTWPTPPNCIRVLGICLGITWPNPDTSIVLGLGACGAGFFLLTFLHYAPMPCYSPTRLWVILTISAGLYFLSGLLESLGIHQIILSILFMIIADRLLNYLLAYVRIKRT